MLAIALVAEFVSEPPFELGELNLIDAIGSLPLPFGLSWIQAVTIAGIVHAGVGILATIVAMRKGESWHHWLPMSLILGTPALIMALRQPSKMP